MPTLYELTGQMQLLYSLMSDPEADPELVADSLEAVSGERDVKLDGSGRVRAQMKADIAAIKAEEERLANRRKVMENNLKRMEEHVKDSMIATGDTKIKTELFTFSIQKNPPKLVHDVEDYRRYDPKFRIIREPEIDWKKVKEALADPDEALFLKDLVHLEQGESLRIR